jgi:dTDP-6-deoxy-L-talose 4-dehydrogenase (NAD+)|tara:strand:- start:2643 stop:3497 length:855 start_codon:yes stop_codon:yes gene_type:complete
MKVLVTGSTGFIGNYVVGELLKYNFDVIASGIELKKVIHPDWLDKVTYIKADLNESRKDWFSFFEKPDMLIHLSWEGLPNYKELFHLERNLPNNYFFLKNMVENGCKKVAVTGTCFEYGIQSGALKEDLETKPDNPYALAKDCLRKFLEQLQKKVDFNLKWIRLFYMYGKGQNTNSILSQLEQSLTRKDKVFNMSGGKQLRDYLPVEKVAEYIVKISIDDKITGIINCCSGEPISIRKFVENYIAEKNKNIELNLGYYPYPDYEPMAFWGDNKKLMKILVKTDH